MVAELVGTESPVAFLDELERALDSVDPTSYLELSPDEARRVAMRIQRLQARLAAHAAAAVLAVDALVPVGLGGSTGTAASWPVTSDATGGQGADRCGSRSRWVSGPRRSARWPRG